jgi:hypothetical protein
MSLCNNQWKCRSGRRRISPTPGTTVVIPETPEDGQRVNEQLLDERLAALEEARAWSPRLISKLESHIRTADDLALFRINAFSFAQSAIYPRTKSSTCFFMPRLLAFSRWIGRCTVRSLRER